MDQCQHIEIGRVGDVIVATFHHERLVDDVMIHDLGQELSRLADEVQGKKVLLNFAQVQMMSSSMLGRLIALHKKAAASGGVLKLCELNGLTRQLFRLTDRDRLFNIEGDQAEAIQALLSA